MFGTRNVVQQGKIYQPIVLDSLNFDTCRSQDYLNVHVYMKYKEGVVKVPVLYEENSTGKYKSILVKVTTRIIIAVFALEMSSGNISVLCPSSNNEY